jgi:hypothetical protein
MDILQISKPDRKWYEIILWWELRRIPYNIAMYLVGLASFYIGYVTLPLLYIIIGLLLNAGFTICWIAELIVRKRIDEQSRIKYSSKTFISYLLFSTVIILGFSLLLFALQLDNKEN